MDKSNLFSSHSCFAKAPHAPCCVLMGTHEAALGLILHLWVVRMDWLASAATTKFEWNVDTDRNKGWLWIASATGNHTTVNSHALIFF